jgi:hypothetical protein
MKRLASLFALVVLCTGIGASCDDDGGGQQDAAVHPDAAGPDAAADVATVTRNTGAACTSAGDCQGPNAQCLTQMTSVPVVGTVFFKNGYCSSDCTGGTDCGADGYCLNGSTFGMPTACMKKCDSNDQCRLVDDDICQNLVVFPESFCFPILVIPDAGTAG